MSLAGKPGYQQTAVGWIPAVWKITLLADVTMESRLRNNAQLDDKLLCGVLKSYGLVPMRERVKGESTDRCKVVAPNAFAYNPMRLNIGSIARNTAEHPVMVSPDYVVFETDHFHLSPNYLDHIRRSGLWERFVGASGDGSVRVRIYYDHLSRLELPLPPLPEQQKIAAILTAVDDKLEVIARQIATTQTLKQGLMQTLFSRGVGTQDDTDWPTEPLREVAEVRTGVAKGKKGLKRPVELPYLRVANVQDGYIDLGEIKTIEVEATQIERYALQVGDVLMTEGGDFDKLGRGDVWGGQISPCLHQNHVFAVRPDPNKLNSYYLAALAASDHGRQYFLSCAKRTTNLASINSSQLKAFPVLICSLDEQARIAEIVDAANAKIEALEAKQRHYQTLKRGLMQKLLTGEWRVKLDSPVEEALCA